MWLGSAQTRHDDAFRDRLMMRDASLYIMLLALAGIAMYQPWMGLLGLAVLNIVHPQGGRSAEAGVLPAYSILLGVTLISTLLARLRGRLEFALLWDWRFAVLILLLLQFCITTLFGINPWAAWPRLLEVGKMFVPLVLMALLIDSREKLRVLLLVIAGSIALVAVKGGFWALITGFRDRVYGAPGSEMAGNNEFAIAVSMAIPLLLLWREEISDRRLRAALFLVTVLCFGAALSSWSRGAFLSLGAMSLLLIWQHRRKNAPLILSVVAIVAVGTMFPEGWLARMTGMGQYQTDESAMGRLEVWRSGWNYLLVHPWLGGGFDSWIYVSLPKGSRDWHNAYIKMGVEHGFPGLLLWGMLLAGTFLDLTRMGGSGKRRRSDWVQRWAAMLRASLTAYAAGAMFLGIVYWELFYWLLMACILTTHFRRQDHRSVRTAQRGEGPRPDRRRGMMLELTGQSEQESEIFTHDIVK